MMKITDNRTGRKTFREIKIGQGFTIPDDDDIYIKIDIVEAVGREDLNAFSLRTASLYEIEDGESVEEVSEMEIIIK